MRYTDLLDQYLAHLATTASAETVRLYDNVLRRAHQQLEVGVVAAGEDELHHWLASHGWSAKTRDTYRCALVGLHRWLHRRGNTSYDPAALLPIPRVGRRLPRPTTDEETIRILTTARQPVRTWAWIAAYCGARAVEITRLSTTDFTPRVILLRGKGERERVVPMHQALWTVLATLPPGPVTTGRFRQPVNLSSWCGKEFRRLGIAGGIHRLRHWFATTTLAAHGNTRVVQELLGHSSLATTQIYTAVTAAALAEAVHALPAIAAPPADDVPRPPDDAPRPPPDAATGRPANAHATTPAPGPPPVRPAAGPARPTTG